MTLLTVIFGLYTQLTGFKVIHVLGRYLKIKKRKEKERCKLEVFAIWTSRFPFEVIGFWVYDSHVIFTQTYSRKINELMHSIYSHNFKHTEFNKIYKTSTWQNRSHKVQIRTFIHERHNKKTNWTSYLKKRTHNKARGCNQQKSLHLTSRDQELFHWNPKKKMKPRREFGLKNSTGKRASVESEWKLKKSEWIYRETPTIVLVFVSYCRFFSSLVESQIIPNYYRDRK